ncbi:MAG TPA: hypothetical protein EYP95_05870 [Nitrospinaceae bacterium]|jgi:hypothetical protein|nr:hypothetical protein [Nitrospinaceae bacterium]
MNEHWEEPREDEGLTLGPEETLQREIEKSKALKVERLHLRDQIDKLKAEKDDLEQKNCQLKKRITELGSAPAVPEEINIFSLKNLTIALILCFLTLLLIKIRI